MSIINKKYSPIIAIIFIISLLVFVTIKSNILTQESRNSDITYTEISLDQAVDRFAEGTYLFIDTRSKFFYQMGHIKNAINFPIENLVVILNDFGYKYPKNTKIVIYCDGLTCTSSYSLAKLLCNRGYYNVEVFFNGWGAWINSSYPIDQINEFPPQ